MEKRLPIALLRLLNNQAAKAPVFRLMNSVSPLGLVTHINDGQLSAMVGSALRFREPSAQTSCAPSCRE